MNHTPGPWAVNEADYPYQDIRIVSGTRGICMVWIDDAPVRDYNDEQQANARLVTAAPDLLAVLRAILNPNNGAIGHLDFGIEAQARAAIKKATGAA